MLLTPEETILAILQQQVACGFQELLNRAYLRYHIRRQDVINACTALQKANMIQLRKIEVPSADKRKVTFVCFTNDKNADDVTKQKADLLAEHYDLREG
jgi:hypothetical protein